MGFLTDWLTDWLKELLIEGIMGNLTGLFDTVHTRVGEIAVQVGTTPAAWNAGVFSLIRQLSETVIKGLGENLRKIAMHTTNEFVTAAVNANHAEGVATWCYFDEFHILLRDPLTASYFVAVWKMLRKKGCVPSALTQNVKDLLASREIENILDNTDFMVLLSQAQSDRAILAKQLGISEHQLSYITHSNSGEGLLFYGNVTIPFVDRFPRGEIYDLLTTRPEDLAHERTDE